MDRIQKILALLGAGICFSAFAQLPLSETEGCLEGPMAQFGQYLGSWDINDSQLAADGTGWSDGGGARWDFVCVGNGTAIQDFWMPNSGGVGTNLRIYQPETNSWDVAWAVTKQPGMTLISASEDADTGNIVMHYKSPIPNPLRRITFFPAEKDSWKWHLEQSRDEGKTWLAVYRISATRR